MVFLIRGWHRNPNFTTNGDLQQASAGARTKVSILIAARNEEENISKTINDILAQDYPRELYELIVADDHSTDRTSEIISSYAAEGVRLLSLREDRALNSYKKKAIADAIDLSTGDLIVTTDADCRMSPAWLSTLVSFYERTDVLLVSSPVVYFQEQDHFEKLQTLEFSFLIGLGAAMIGNNIPSTCNGANLAYRKSVFYELEGFKGIDDLASGDDELFLHKVTSRYPGRVGFCKSEQAIVYTHAKPDLTEFIRQRKRWASKTVKYKNKKIVTLGICIWAFNLGILLGALAGFFIPGGWIFMGAMLCAKFILELIFLVPVTRFIGRAWLILYLPLLTVLHVLYMVLIGLLGNSGKYVWKGRLVR
ncbi:glycosyltransferase [Pedobacter sp. HMF7056]|uniref:Glycosyltransferase n=2 Tax=Hufsiella ginkgonis TaxID=2695274 RepID=A0A7K1Y3S0_9SPHI|nr:glycosyltransferase [Hufsiella ginkgonis]